MFYRRTDRANSTRIGVHSPLAMLAGGSLLVMSVTLNISTPSLAASSYSSAHVEAHESWPSDWADSSFCSTIGVRYMGNSFDGVAACGDQYRNSSSNTQGEISYKGVEFDSVGFQCVELAARYDHWEDSAKSKRESLRPRCNQCRSAAEFISQHRYIPINIENGRHYQYGPD